MYKRRPIIKHNNILHERMSSFSRPIYIYERARTDDETVAAVSPAHCIKRPWRRHSPRADACDIGDATGTHRSGPPISVFWPRAVQNSFCTRNFFSLHRFPLSSSAGDAFLFLLRHNIRVRFFFHAERVPRTRFPPIFCHRAKRFFRFRADSLSSKHITHSRHQPPPATEALNSSGFFEKQNTRAPRGHVTNGVLFNVIPTSRKPTGCRYDTNNDV